jgi:hypothetical protein
MVEAGSHELGHNLGLSHDGIAGGATYYDGHGSGATSWAPIMGVGYYVNVSQWSKGEYASASNGEDDLAIVAGKLSTRPDDHGGTAQAASTLVVENGTVASETPVSDPFRTAPEQNRGVIGSSTDVDAFRFTVTESGTADLTVTPGWLDDFENQPLRSANLHADIALHRFDPGDPGSFGSLVGQASSATETHATISAAIDPGTYFLVVRGRGTRTAATGYTDYGSLGRYFVRGTVPHGQSAVTLTVSRTGPGRVTTAGGEIDCGKACGADFATGAKVVLKAVVTSGVRFLGWTGACGGTAKDCTVTMTGDRTVGASFGKADVIVRVARAGLGKGGITSRPAGIACGKDCSDDFPADKSVTLTAVAGKNARFAYWTGACAGQRGVCTLVPGADTSSTAVFNRTTGFVLAVAKKGRGAGRVASTSVAGIACGAACSARFPRGTTVTLRATALPGSRFAGWSGACTGVKPTCRVSMSAAKTVTAAFVPAADPRVAGLPR